MTFLSLQSSINTGLDYILNHFASSSIWPRTISTKTTAHRQVVTNSIEEAIARFAQANFLDCRISAYPPNVEENPSAIARFQGLRVATPRHIIVIIDLDKSSFKFEKTLRITLTKTLQNIKNQLGQCILPTVIWTGNGYHIYLVLDSEGIVLENVKEFSDLKVDQVSLNLKFLRFVEWYLSSGKSDNAHNTTVSFNNCMMRIPGSYNSKEKCTSPEVRIIQQWNGYKSSIKPLLRPFYVYLCDQRIKQLEKCHNHNHKISRDIITGNGNGNNNYQIVWIDKLLQTPIEDYRKYCIWRILAPYLINIKKLPEQNCYDIIKRWLDECNQLKRLDFNTNQKIREGLATLSNKGYLPISYDKLKEENPGLCQKIN